MVTKRKSKAKPIKTQDIDESSLTNEKNGLSTSSNNVTKDSDSKAWTVRGVSYEAITFAQNQAKKEKKFLGQFLSEVIIKYVHEQVKKPREIAKIEDVNTDHILKELMKEVRELREISEYRNKSWLERWMTKRTNND